MATDIAALINEATRYSTQARKYTGRIGLLNLTKKNGDVPAAWHLWVATEEKVKQIATQYKSRESIKTALESQHSLLYEITDSLLVDYGPKIWNDGGKEGTFVTKVDKNLYPKHLVYKNIKDKLIIRKQLFGWVVQRACRRAMDTLREGRNRPTRKYLTTKPILSNFTEAVDIHRRGRRFGQGTPVSDTGDDNMTDELALTPCKASKAARPYRNEPTDTINVKLSLRTREQSMALSNSAKLEFGEGVCKSTPSPNPAITRIAASAGDKYRRSVSANQMGVDSQPLCRQRKRKDKSKKAQPGSDLVSKIAKKNSTRKTIGVPKAPSCLALASPLLSVLEQRDPGTHDLEELQQTVTLATMISHNDAGRLRTTLGHAYERCMESLERWLTCIKAVVAFRQLTGFSGDMAERAAFCADNLTPEQKKSARRLLTHVAPRKTEWLSVPGFSNTLALLLLEMTSWGDIPMSLEEMVEYLLPFNEYLLAWF